MEKEFISRVALFVLIDNDGRALLQHRDMDAPRNAGLWAFFGGEIEKAESPKEAAIREAKEELGLELSNLKFFRRYEFRQDDGYHEKFMFTAPLELVVSELKEQQREGDDLGVFSEGDLETMQLSEWDVKILRDIFRELPSG